MTFDPQRLLARPPMVTRQTYTRRDVILYALGVGVGIENPCDERELRFLYEKNLMALPTFAIVAAAPAFWLDEPTLGIDWRKVLNAGQELVLHRGMPVEGSVLTELRIDALWDKGREKGAVMDSSRTLRREDGELLATVKQTHFLRGNGGFGGEDAPRDPVTFQPDARAPDITIDLPTRVDQALIYRLSGDFNPLHIDPQVATTAGFDKPILHGSCTFGVVARAVLRAVADSDPARLDSFGARFSRPVYPGDTIRTEIWRSGQQVHFRASALERNITVLDRGKAQVAPR